MTASPFVEGSERPEYGDPHDGAAVVRCWLVEPVAAGSAIPAMIVFHSLLPGTRAASKEAARAQSEWPWLLRNFGI